MPSEALEMHCYVHGMLNIPYRKSCIFKRYAFSAWYATPLTHQSLLVLAKRRHLSGSFHKDSGSTLFSSSKLSLSFSLCIRRWASPMFLNGFIFVMVSSQPVPIFMRSLTGLLLWVASAHASSHQSISVFQAGKRHFLRYCISAMLLRCVWSPWKSCLCSTSCGTEPASGFRNAYVCKRMQLSEQHSFGSVHELQGGVDL